jgi:epoxyqueuosine reductase
MTTWTSEDPKGSIRAAAAALGFEACGFASASQPWPASGRLKTFIAEGRHGTMDWMAATAARRGHPTALWDKAKSAIVLGMNYGPHDDPLEATRRPGRAAISVYARGRDYHGLIKGRLKTLAGQVARRMGGEVKVFVDTAPLMEKPLAARAGLGWQGKHTNLVSRDFGSWLFLGVILTSLDLIPDPPESDHCGACRACLDICPTHAFVAPYQLDARACLSYLTIEHAGPMPVKYRAAMGNRVFGCDDCLAVCPWNKFASVAAETQLAAREALSAPDLADLAGLDDAAFRALFSASPVKRIGRDRLVRNVLYAIGNSGEPALAEAARARLGDASETVREAAAWALGRLGARREGAKPGPDRGHPGPAIFLDRRKLGRVDLEARGGRDQDA